MKEYKTNGIFLINYADKFSIPKVCFAKVNVLNKSWYAITSNLSGKLPNYMFNDDGQYVTLNDINSENTFTMLCYKKYHGRMHFTLNEYFEEQKPPLCVPTHVFIKQYPETITYTTSLFPYRLIPELNKEIVTLQELATAENKINLQIEKDIPHTFDTMYWCRKSQEKTIK